LFLIKKINKEAEMAHKLFQIDAFSQEAFKGNPAGVCLLTEPVSDEWMQALASEMNLSETAFLLLEKDGWRLRWFTPTTEVDLCGHATLASAYVLFNTQPSLKEKAVHFFSRSGMLIARWVDGMVELDFPAMEYQSLSYPDKFMQIFGFQPLIGVFSGSFYLFEAESEQEVMDSNPDFVELARLNMPEVIITARTSKEGVDFISRFFAPQLGINEDPVTGSAHCLLAPYWGNKLRKKKMKAYQASKRGGTLYLNWAGERVLISGAATMIFEASLLID
jgi:PhzF family phenazine biosynthesis protein